MVILGYICDFVKKFIKCLILLFGPEEFQFVAFRKALFEFCNNFLSSAYEVSQRLILPMKERNFLSVLGGLRFMMSCILERLGRTPSLSISKPSHSISLTENSHLENFREKPSESIFFRVSSTFTLCSSREPAVAIKISSKNRS